MAPDDKQENSVTPASAGRPDLERFMRAHALPAAFIDVIERHYVPLAAWLAARCRPGSVYEFGINGAQGTGKSTLAAFLKLALEAGGRRVVILSLDDFYLDRKSRQALAASVHPLLAVRGVPGTHDTALLDSALQRLHGLKRDQSLRLPCFDKATDDRVSADAWRIVSGPVDIVILEGWCVGVPAQPDAELRQPVNALEAAEDRDGRWREHVNNSLRDRYAPIFAGLDALCYLKVPDVQTILEWRGEQERKLAMRRDGPAIMSRDELVRFIQFFERLTTVALEHLPGTADVVIELDRNHGCVSSRYRGGGRGTAVTQTF